MSTLNVINPSTQSLIETLEQDSIEQALKKVDQARVFFDNKALHLKIHERISLLEKLSSLIEQDFNDYASLIAAEGGKPLQDAQVETTRAIAGIKTAIQKISEYRGEVIPLGANAASSDHSATTEHFPLGPVLAFSAFNHPLNLIIHQIIPAFAAGNPCIVKPAPDTPLSCLKLVKAMLQVGIPEDYIRCVITESIETASALVTSDKISFFSFIGSSKIGWMLRSKLQPGVRCALEHGGIAPCIVSPSADLNTAVPAIAKGGFYHAGQVCVSTQRVFVHHSIFDKFSQALSQHVDGLITGDASDSKTEVGPLIRQNEVKRINEWVQDAIASGADCLNGGTIYEGSDMDGNALKGNFYLPTLLSKPSPDAIVSQHEIFGPVVCLYPYEDLEHTFQIANNTPFAFQAAIFSENVHEIEQAYQSLNASAVMVNTHTAFRDDTMPFAGLQSSGLGTGGIGYTIEDMQYEKMKVVKN